jgi:outer membrane receptor protein involved in Fe transport
MKSILVKKLLFVGFRIFLSVASAASTAGNGTTGSVEGKVLDSGSSDGLEFATVALYNAADSSLITGTITDRDGIFKLSGLSEGDYFIRVDFVGYQKMDVPINIIENQENHLKLDLIYLNPAIEYIEEVTIKNDEPYLSYKIDRKVVNVSQHISSAGGTAADVLENSPSVDTDIEGNVTLRGSSDFTVLINGRPTILEGSDALSQIPASAIENIEIITNPSAKYDPDGTAGIINVKMKKSKSNGFSGLVSGSAGSTPLYSGNVLLNYKTEKMNVTGGAKYNYNNGSMNKTLYRENYYADSVFILNTKDTGNRFRSGLTLTGGIEYNIIENNTLSVAGSYSEFNSERNSYSQSSKQLLIGNILDYYTTDNSLHSSKNGFQFEFSDVHQFDTQNHQLNLSSTIYRGTGTSEEIQYQFITDENWIPIGPETESIKKLTYSDEISYDLYLDYTKPVGNNGFFEGGYQLSYDKSITDYIYQSYDQDIWSNDVLPSTVFDFSRTIHALYGTYSDRFGAYDFKVGLRSEYTHRVLEQESNEDIFSYQKLDFYPSVYITRSFLNDHQIQLSYSRRINRPRDKFLSPITNYSDGFYSFIGNPELEPEHANLIELNYQKDFGSSFLAIETFFRHTDNKITQVQHLTDSNLLIYTLDNLNSDYTMGAEIMGNFNPLSWWQINPSFSISRYQLNGTVDTQDIIKTSTNWNTRLDNTFNLSTGTSFQVQGVYKSPSVTLTGNTDAMYGLNMAVKQEIFNNKATLSLSVRDVFDTMHRSYTIDNIDYYVMGDMSREAPVFTLSFSYRFNNFKNNDFNKGERNENTIDYELY